MNFSDDCSNYSKNIKEFSVLFDEDMNARVKLTFGVIISLAALILNSMCLKIKFNHQTNYLVFYSKVSISISFMLFAITSMPMNTVYSVYLNEYYTPMYGLTCTMWYVVDCSLYNTFIIFTIILSYHQYQSLKKKITKERNKSNGLKNAIFNKYFLMTIAIWLGPFTCWTVTGVIYYNFYYDACYPQYCFFASIEYTAIVLILAFFMPLLTLVVITIFIIHGVVKKIKNKVINLNIKTKTDLRKSRLSTINFLYTEKPNRAREITLSKDKRALKFLLCNVIVYIICWMPYVFVPILSQNIYVNYYVYLLAYSNSILYPIIFLIFK